MVLIGKEGFEPPLPDSESSVLPIRRLPINTDTRLGREDSNLHRLIQSQVSYRLDDFLVLNKNCGLCGPQLKEQDDKRLLLQQGLHTRK